MTHWAAPLIGLPWAPAPADPPRSFYCWGLVRHALWLGYQVDMPELGIGDEEVGVSAIKQAANGWQQVDSAVRERDIVLLRSSEGRHVGLMIQVAHKLLLLHCDGRLDADGKPTGSVKAQDLGQAIAFRYLGAPELWRMK